MCYSIHNSNMSTLLLDQNIGILSKISVFYLTFAFSAFVGTPLYIYTRVHTSRYSLQLCLILM